MQETGDFCKISIAGLESKTQGCIMHEASSKRYIGLSQLPNDKEIRDKFKRPINEEANSAEEAAGWAKANGIDYVTENRKLAENSIYLTAAYFGRILEMIKMDVLNKIPDCQDKKRMVFAAYNKGAGLIRSACNAVGKNASWQNIQPYYRPAIIAAFKEKGYKEVYELYVPNIEKRLTYK